MSARPNLCFFSNRCSHSKKFIDALQSVPEVHQRFSMWCIETTGLRLPPFVKSVPTIAVVDNRGNRYVLAGSAAFMWLAKKTNRLEDFDPSMAMSTKISADYSSLDGEDRDASHFKSFFTLSEDPRKFAIETKVIDGSSESSGQIDQIAQQRTSEITDMFGNGPGNVPSFQLGNQEQRMGGNINLNTLQQQRQNDTRMGGVPHRAPNFQVRNSGTGTGTGTGTGSNRVDFQSAQNRPDFNIPRQSQDNLDFTKSIY